MRVPVGGGGGGRMLQVEIPEVDIWYAGGKTRRPDGLCRKRRTGQGQGGEGSEAGGGSPGATCLRKVCGFCSQRDGEPLENFK